MVKGRRKISISSTPIKINRSNKEDEEDKEDEELDAELERDYYLESKDSSDQNYSNDQRDLNEQHNSNEKSKEFKEEYSENGSINCPKLINFYSDYYQQNSKVILFIAMLDTNAKDVQDAQYVKDFKDVQDFKDAQDAKDIKKHKPKSESYDYNDTPSKKSKEKEKYDELTTYKYVVLIICYINLKFDCISILYTNLFGIFKIFNKNINLGDFKDNMIRLIIDIEKPDDEKLFYYDVEFIKYLKKNINDKEIIKKNLNSKNINTISIKKKIMLLNDEIKKFLDWNYHMADNKYLKYSQHIQSVSKEFENNTKKYYKFNDRIITKFSKVKKISPNKSTCFPFCKKKNEFEENYLTYKNIFRNYILIDLKLFKKILIDVSVHIDKLHQLWVDRGMLIEKGKILYLKDYKIFKDNIIPRIDIEINFYEELIDIFGFNVTKNIPVLISEKFPNYDKDLNKKKTRCSKIITPLQVGGSCWFMATIVAMFYSQLSKKLLLKQIKNFKTINKIRIDENGIQLYDIFHNILNDKGTSNDYNSDIKENTYWKIMSLLHKKDENIFPYKPVVNEGYNSDFYIGRLYNLLNIDYTIIEYNTDTKNKYMVYSLLNEEYNDYYTIFFNGNTMKKEISSIQIVKKKVNDFISNLRGTTLFTKSPNILIVMIKDSEYDNIYGLNEYSKKMKKLKEDNYEEIKTMKDIITYNDNKYKLDSVILANHYLDTTDNPIHNVAGITCKQNKYIYNGWPRSNMTQDNQQRHQLACELIKSNWDIKGDADFCLNNSTNCMDKINDVKNYDREHILNLRKRYKGTKNLESHKNFIEDIKNKLCFNFSKGYRTLIYVKKGATSSASAESLSPASAESLSPAPAARSPAAAKPVAKPAAKPAPAPANAKYTFKYKFAKEPPNQLKYTPIYNSKGEPYLKNNNKEANFMASLNAGDSDLYVGGAYINAEFNKAIVAKNEVDTDLENLSIFLHETCFKECYNEIKSIQGKSEGYFYKFDLLKYSEEYFNEMYLYISEKELKIPGRKGIGNIYIDILKKNPYNNPANKAMIYCYGPEGKKMNSDNMNEFNMDDNLKGNAMVEFIFLYYVYITGKNIAKAIFKYNQYQKTKTNRIDYVRICLISGNDYLPIFMKDNMELSQKKVANKIIEGIHKANLELESNINNTFDQDIVYEFAYANNAFNNAHIHHSLNRQADMGIQDMIQNYLIK